MTTKDDFTTEEWAQVSALPVLVTAGAAFADGRKVVSTVREIVSGQKALAEGIAKYPNNTLVQAFGEDGPNADLSQGMKSKKVSDVVGALTEQIAAGWAVLKSKATPDEVSDVAELLKAVGLAAAQRTGSGPLGFGGDKVDDTERAFLDTLTGILAG
ncbi:MAG: hypothetical protein NTZ03_07945 [Actinobacteria bacterium]|nr:hypothetical protein [Actinomycetota bacterium]